MWHQTEFTGRVKKSEIMLHEIAKRLVRSEGEFAIRNLLRKAVDKADKEFVCEVLAENLKIDIGHYDREFVVPQYIQDGTFSRLLNAVDGLSFVFKKTEVVSSASFSGKISGSNPDSL